MKLHYHPDIIDQKISLKKLRPKKSYDSLIKNRCHALKGLLDEQGNIKRNFLLTRNCPVCDSSSSSIKLTKDKLNIVECNQCQLLFVNPVLNKKKCLEVYKSNEYSEIVESLVRSSHEYRRKRFGKERVDYIEKYITSGLPKKLLEIGCSTGFMLEEAVSRGWEAMGIELNPAAVKFGKKRGLNIIDKTT